MNCDLTKAVWRKSSHSGNTGGQCVELASINGATAVRDSKNPGGSALIFRRDELAGFLTAVKAGRFTR